MRFLIFTINIHPRIQSDFDRVPIRIVYFDYAYEHSKAPLVFNGEIKTLVDINNTFRKYDTVNAVMLGRGLIANPQLAMDYASGKESDFDFNKFKQFI